MQEESRINELIQNNIPEEYAREMVESQRFRRDFMRQQEQHQQTQAEQQQYVDLVNTFRELNDRDFDPNKDSIPDEVFNTAREQGVSLKNAYESFMNRQMKQQLKVYQQNEQNFKKNPGGGTQKHGSTGNRSKDSFEEGFDSYW